jgi:glycosyltransferase involved in cell wall biosynthesis
MPPRLVAMLPVRNEAERHLVPVLQQLTRLADAVAVYDDGSSDLTPDIVAAFPSASLHRGEGHLFATDESLLRRRLWRFTVELEPDWILALDADELFERRAEVELRLLIEQDDYDAVAFRIFDLWKSEVAVRTDGAWNPWNRFSPLLVRYRPELSDAWSELPIHCGRLPLAYRDAVTFFSDLRVRHLGWARGEEHLRKYLFYRQRDLATRGRVEPHTESVLSPFVTLEPWIEARTPDWLPLVEGVRP